MTVFLTVDERSAIAFFGRFRNALMETVFKEGSGLEAPTQVQWDLILALMLPGVHQSFAQARKEGRREMLLTIRRQLEECEAIERP